MTDKLKCPFCGAELTINQHPFDGCVKAQCINIACRYATWTFPLEIWQLIIDGKKAQEALKVARNLYQELALAYCEMADDYRTTYGWLKTPEQETQEYMQEYDEKITSITTETKQEYKK